MHPTRLQLLGAVYLSSHADSFPLRNYSFNFSRKLLNPGSHCDHDVGFRSQRCSRNFFRNSTGSAPSPLAAQFASTFFTFLIPGIVVLTSEQLKINRNAISGIVLPAGTNGRSASACATLDFRFSGTKYVLRQSFAGHFEAIVSVPVNVPSSNGTRAITAAFFNRQTGNSASSGF